MRATIYDAVGIGMLLGGVFFFYRSVEFLAQKDYVAAVIALGMGLLILRTGVELGRLSFVIRKSEK